jgi:hypothetical protein
VTQIPTRITTIESVMRSRAFKAGVEDVRAGRPARFDELDDRDWGYGRGRQWATLAPMSMPLRVGNRLNPDAVNLFRRELEYIL